jgi:hypothetical protein
LKKSLKLYSERYWRTIFCSVAFEIKEDRLPLHSQENSVQNSSKINNIIENTAQANNAMTDNKNNTKEIGEEPNLNEPLTYDEAVKNQD